MIISLKSIFLGKYSWNVDFEGFIFNQCILSKINIESCIVCLWQLYSKNWSLLSQPPPLPQKMCAGRKKVKGPISKGSVT